jgi:hypothetical protein
MTLGCGGFGGNITSDNISPRHLLNIKRLAYEIRPAAGATARPAAQDAPVPPAAKGIGAPALGARIDQFLRSRGFAPDGAPAGGVVRPAEGRPVVAERPSRPPDRGTAMAPSPGAAPPPSAEPPAAFVCEDDVRQAQRTGRTLLVNERTIITPAARDLGEAGRVFRYAGSDRPR